MLLWTRLILIFTHYNSYIFVLFTVVCQSNHKPWTFSSICHLTPSHVYACEETTQDSAWFWNEREKMHGFQKYIQLKIVKSQLSIYIKTICFYTLKWNKVQSNDFRTSLINNYTPSVCNAISGKIQLLCEGHRGLLERINSIRKTKKQLRNIPKIWVVKKFKVR